MKTKNMTLVSLSMVLLAAVAVSFLISRPGLFVKRQSMPVFMGEEIIIEKGVEGIGGVKTASKAKVEKAVEASKAISQLVPQPKVAAPLPIVPPSISYRVLPEYPVSALEQGRQGTAVLAIYVGTKGTAEKVDVKSSSGVSELDESAVAAVSQWKFNPATQSGKALASWFELPVRFAIN